MEQNMFEVHMCIVQVVGEFVRVAKGPDENMQRFVQVEKGQEL